MSLGKQKVGRITVAIGLIAYGVALLIDNLVSTHEATSLVLKFWPTILIGYGLEYLVRSILSQRNQEEVRLKFDIGGAFLLFLLVMVSAGVSTFRQWTNDIPTNVSLNGPQAQLTETARAPAKGVRELQVEAKTGSITVRPTHDNDEIRVEATYSTHVALFFFQADRRKELAKPEIKIETEGEIVRILDGRATSLSDISTSYVVYAPPGLKVKAKSIAGSMYVYDYKGDLDLTSSAAFINVSRSSGSLKANSGAGSITIQGFDGPVTARANAGQMNVEDVAGAIQLESLAGAIHIRDFRGGKLVAETGTGRIDASAQSLLEGDVMLKARTGNVTLTVPKESSMRFSAQTRTGIVNLPRPFTTSQNGLGHSGVGTVEAGTYAVTLEVGTGSVNFDLR